MYFAFADLYREHLINSDDESIENISLWKLVTVMGPLVLMVGILTFFLADDIAHRPASERGRAWALYLLPLAVGFVFSATAFSRMKGSAAPRGHVARTTAVLLGPALLLSFLVRRSGMGITFPVAGLAAGFFLGLALVAAPLRRWRATKARRHPSSQS